MARKKNLYKEMKKFLDKKSEEILNSEKNAKELLGETIREVKERFTSSPEWEQYEAVAFFESFKEFFRDFVIKGRIRERAEYQTKICLSGPEKYAKDEYVKREYLDRDYMESAIEEFIKENPRPVLFMAAVISSDKDGNTIENFFQKAQEFNIKYLAIDFAAQIDEACGTDILRNYLIKITEQRGHTKIAGILKKDLGREETIAEKIGINLEDFFEEESSARKNKTKKSEPSFKDV
jgi:hypothetical protein